MRRRCYPSTSNLSSRHRSRLSSEQGWLESPCRAAFLRAWVHRKSCTLKCSFCGVPKLEGMQRDTDSLTSLVRSIDEIYGAKKDLMLMDNNVVASPRFKDIIAEIKDLGVTTGDEIRH